MDDVLTIWVYRSNLSAAALPVIARLLADWPHVHRWTVDLDDADAILRLETGPLFQPDNLHHALRTHGIHILELA